MAEESESGERTEEATVQRREEFRRQGQVVQSREVASALFLLVSAGLLALLGQFYLKQIVELYHIVFEQAIPEVSRTGNIAASSGLIATKAILLAGPALLMSLLLGFASSVLQVGFLYSEEAIQLKFERMDPIQGLQRLFSLRAVVEGFKAVLKVTVVGFIIYLVLERELVRAPFLMTLGLQQILDYLGDGTLKIVFSAALFMVVLAVLDYGYLYWDMEQRMKMTKQEVKEEHKAREGDPLIKSRIRRLQREVANKRMMDEVPKADVIITNPTHIAVALKYDETMPAPKLIAKGAGYLAEKIKAVAKENRIPVLENKPLARTIYKTLKLGQLIPRELYNAVAEVLAYVFRLRKRARKS